MLAQGASSRFVAGASVRHADVDGLRVILDLQSESYFTLDEVASAMWTCLTESADRDDACARLATRFDVGLERLQADLVRFASACVERGFLESARPPERPQSPSPIARQVASAPGNAPSSLLVARATYCLFSTSLALKRRGFRAVYERYARLPPAARQEKLARASRAFLLAENFYVSRRAPDDCLLRSLALFRFLRGSGLRAEHVIGVRRVPFAVHAWVECDGRPVLDDSPARPGMTPLARACANG